MTKPRSPLRIAGYVVATLIAFPFIALICAGIAVLAVAAGIYDVLVRHAGMFAIAASIAFVGWLYLGVHQ